MHAMWRHVFGNDHRVEVEIGCGTGTFLLAASARNPHVNFFGIEHSFSRATHLATALAETGRQNARVIAADASCVIAHIIPPASVDTYHVYFPDPWWKRRHHRRRLLTPAFAAALARTLADGGRIYMVTDVPDVFALALKTFGARSELARHAELPPPRPGATVFERKGLARGAAIEEVTFVKVAAAGAPDVHTSSAAPITPAESPS